LLLAGVVVLIVANCVAIEVGRGWALPLWLLSAATMATAFMGFPRQQK
jgi:hypothetical protein